MATKKNETSEIAVASVTERRTQWVETAKNLQQRAQELAQELGRVNEQLSQLNGAIQACDVILQGVEPAVGTSTE